MPAHADAAATPPAHPPPDATAVPGVPLALQTPTFDALRRLWVEMLLHRDAIPADRRPVLDRKVSAVATEARRGGIPLEAVLAGLTALERHYGAAPELRARAGRIAVHAYYFDP